MGQGDECQSERRLLLHEGGAGADEQAGPRTMPVSIQGGPIPHNFGR